MPTSKKPRKKGRHGQIVAASRKLLAKKFKDKDDAVRTIKLLDEASARDTLARRKYEWMSAMLDKEDLIEGFTRAHTSLNRLPTTKDRKDFNIVSSSLMLGAMCHMRLGVEEQSWMTDIRRATFGIVSALRIFKSGQAVPEANLPLIREGLNAAQDLIEFAFDNDPQALKEVLIKNDPVYTDMHPEETEARERFILGDRYDQVASWGWDEEKTE